MAALSLTRNPDLPPAGGEETPLIDLSEAAAAEIRRLRETQNLQDRYLRVAVQGGGCSGLTYQLGFDGEIGEDDRTLLIKGVPVVIDLKSALYLRGTVIDYAPALIGGGFKFSNPNARKSCGCGTSFSA